MAGSGIRTIIFDIGRVLVRVDVGRAKAGLAKGLALLPRNCGPPSRKIRAGVIGRKDACRHATGT